MRIGVPKEIAPGERRVAITPDVVKKLKKGEVEIVVEEGAGLSAGFPDEMYAQAGARIEPDVEAVWRSDVVLKVQRPVERPDGSDEIALLKEGSVYISHLNPLFEPKRMAAIAARQVSAFAMELVPRTTRAQSMDALSSQANIAGYKAVLMAADRLPKIMPMLMTAAGTIKPARVLIVGAGVAGLQAIATARRLGAVVEAYDAREVVREQVKSLGAKFVDIDIGEKAEGEGGYARELSEEAKARQREKLGLVAKACDIVITTAAVPGRQAPRLLDKSAVLAMKHGAVIVDMAAATGGNVEGSLPDEEVRIGGVTLLGPTNLPATMPHDASQMYARNVAELLGLMLHDGKLALDFEDDIIEAACVTNGGAIVNPRVRSALER